MLHERPARTGSDLVMVDDWEARQPKYQRSKEVLAHFTEELGRQPLCAVDASGQPVPVQVMLLCGTDLLESFVRPGVWRPGDVEHILVTHGVACVLRRGCDLGTLLVEEGAPLRRFRDRVILVKEPFDNSVSSSTVRQELRRGHSVKYIVSDAVIEYIKAKGLYAEDEQDTKVEG
ncbi:unnamed protein product [Ostreobium quekettii]|uniref:Nicotinamide-nucleotide adenylyltransferase n=1 Tax=Ostreobium quekettii TaxID=121088 RepID=A0A8S1JCW6_9CHLO|nr:unnamed protein product [Ostreobium quekettii]